MVAIIVIIFQYLTLRILLLTLKNDLKFINSETIVHLVVPHNYYIIYLYRLVFSLARKHSQEDNVMKVLTILRITNVSTMKINKHFSFLQSWLWLNSRSDMLFDVCEFERKTIASVMHPFQIPYFWRSAWSVLFLIENCLSPVVFHFLFFVLHTHLYSMTTS